METKTNLSCVIEQIQYITDLLDYFQRNFRSNFGVIEEAIGLLNKQTSIKLMALNFQGTSTQWNKFFSYSIFHMSVVKSYNENILPYKQTWWLYSGNAKKLNFDSSHVKPDDQISLDIDLMTKYLSIETLICELLG